jgi:hypothetical protein
MLGLAGLHADGMIDGCTNDDDEACAEARTANEGSPMRGVVAVDRNTARAVLSSSRRWRVILMSALRAVLISVVAFWFVEFAWLLIVGGLAIAEALVLLGLAIVFGLWLNRRIERRRTSNRSAIHSA